MTDTIDTKEIPGLGGEVTRETLAGMTERELCIYGRLNYGLQNITPKTPKLELINLIMDTARHHKGNAEMHVVDKDAEHGSENAPEVPPGYVKIRVSAGENNPGRRPIPLGMNFRTATIPVDRDIIMPAKWESCLKDAVQTKYYLERKDDGTEEFKASEQHSYPYTILERG